MEYETTDRRCERMWEHDGHVCAVLLEPTFLNRCGYVWVAPGSPLQGVRCGDEAVFDMIVHGGVTFANWLAVGDIDNDVPDQFGWAFGFDCGHFGDAPDVRAGIERFGDCDEYHSDWFEQRHAWNQIFGYPHTWTLEEAVAETERLCEQVARKEREDAPRA